MTMMPDSQAYTKVRSIISARTAAKKSLMKIHRHIRESHLMLILAQAGLRVKQVCQGTQDDSLSRSKLYNKILRNLRRYDSKIFSGNPPEFLKAGDIHHSSKLIYVLNVYSTITADLKNMHREKTWMIPFNFG
jgi:hypothetical protein